jgi:phospholipid/cholesterol/gamma-HCH transport system substrate-binding protein
MQSNTKTNFFVGLFVLAGMIGLVFLALQAANLSSFTGGKTYVVRANFDNIGGLKVHSPVKSAGVVVGRVQHVGYDNETYQAEVTLAIESKYTFPSDTSAKILTSGLLGEQYVGLQPGAEDENLKNGSKILYTQSAVVLETLISQFMFNKAEDNASASK